MLNIRTNNVPRFTLDAYELTEKERVEFDYLNWDAIDSGDDRSTFIRFKGQLYDLSRFMRVDYSCGMKGWDGYSSNCAYSGLLVKYVGPEGYSDKVIVGQYFS